MTTSKRIAIVGSGCSGLAALWALSTSTQHEVHLFEEASRLGGHTNTVTFEGPKGDKTPVDTGFIVMNSATYPNFISFLAHIGVTTAKTDMTFGVSRDQGHFEWAGTSLASIFAQRRNLLSPGMWRLIFDVIRFNEFALDLLAQEGEGIRGNDEGVDNTGHDGMQSQAAEGESIGDYLQRQSYSQEFIDNYLVPMTAAVWSTSPDKCSLQFPAVTLVRFMWNHHLLTTVAKRPDWMTIPGGSKLYVDKVLEGIPTERVRLNSKVTGLVPAKDGSVTITVNGQEEVFDHCILATHGDQALQILQPVATVEELSILSAFKTSRNFAVLHSDTSLMPRRRIAWSAWNYITESPFPPAASKNIDKVCLTYWMNLLQHIPEKQFGPVLVTLNPLAMPEPRKCQGIWEYEHPLYTADAIQAQEQLPKIQNTRGISYAGAWTKYGFHEDGFSSGLRCALDLGATLPFEFVDSTYSRGRKPELRLKNYLLRLVLLGLQILVLMMERGWHRALLFLERVVAMRKKLD